MHLLVRSAQPRALTAGGLLPDYCAALPEQARETIDVPAKGKQPARKATVAMRYGPVSLKRPANSSDNGQPETVSLWVVDVQEIDPPEGVERVHWRLLTTHTVTTLEQARQIVAWYRMRWTIEQVFRSMKSDCLRIEDLQMEDANCFTKLAIVGLIAAIRSMQLVMARDGSTSQPITDAADPADMPALRALNTSLEGRTKKLRNPHDESLLAWYAWIVARLGGWSGRTSRGYRPPGPKTMHHGLLRLDPILAGWRLANRSADARSGSANRGAARSYPQSRQARLQLECRRPGAPPSTPAALDKINGLDALLRNERESCEREGQQRVASAEVGQEHRMARLQAACCEWPISTGVGQHGSSHGKGGSTDLSQAPTAWGSRG